MRNMETSDCSRGKLGSDANVHIRNGSSMGDLIGGGEVRTYS